MAEFQEVMKQANRMCKTVGACGKCPLRTMEQECRFASVINADFGPDGAKAIEHIVMDWAAAHPEPRYPTWNEWYKATFPNSNYHTIPCPSMFYKICETSNYHGEVECYECKNQPIPADIAEKLGVKPIGGDENG